MPGRHANPGSEVGIDRGVAVAVATSDATGYDRVFITSGEEHRYLRLQRKLARQRKGSANRRKTLAKMRRIKRSERDRRADFCAQVAHRITTSNALVVLEDLPTRNMTRSARGSVEQPGSNVAQKAGLNRSILSKGWHAFELALRNAARTTGSTIVKTPATYTSQRCFVCRSVDPASRESQAVYRCTTCGHSGHADVNAARNILAAGRKEADVLQAVTACGDLQPLGGSAKQQALCPFRPPGFRGISRCQHRCRAHAQPAGLSYLVPRLRRSTTSGSPSPRPSRPPRPPCCSCEVSARTRSDAAREYLQRRTTEGRSKREIIRCLPRTLPSSGRLPNYPRCTHHARLTIR